MDMNIKGVEKELVGAAKVAAWGKGETLREWVIRVIQEALNGHTSGGGGGRKVRAGVGAPSRVGTVERGISEGNRGAGETSEEPDNGTEAVSAVSRGGEARVLGRGSHDTENCRVRGCGMCKVIGVKDSARGLK